MSTPPDASKEQWRLLTDGHHIPLLGLGVWQIPNGSACVDAVRWAIEFGYRHIDTAQEYGNEESVGTALKESGLSRDEIFVTTKFQPYSKDPVTELQASLKRLDLDYVDLYLVHWPHGGSTWAWPGMERAHDLGLTRSVGVSNFNVDELDQVLGGATTPPVINQVQYSPFENRRALREGATKRHIVTEAYSPLGTGRHLGDETVAGIASSIGRTPAQVLLRWAVQQGLVVLPKSSHRGRIEENAQIFDFALSAEEMSTLDSLDHTGGTNDSREDKWWH